MRACLGVAILCAAAVTGIATHPSRAQYAAQFYPYCALSAASGATTCYYRSREECGGSCISNPWYIGLNYAAAEAYARRRKAVRYLRPAARH